MKVKARKLLSLLLTLAMVAGMFVVPASAASLGENSQYIIDFGANSGTTLPTPVEDSIYNLNSTAGKKDISYTYDGRTYTTAAKFDSGGKITVTPDAAGTLKIVIVAAKSGSTLDFCGEEKSLGTDVVEFTKTLEAGTAYNIVRKKNELHVLRLEFEPSGGGDDTTSATPKFATGGDKCTLAEGGNTATFTLKDAVTTSTVYKLYDAATDGTLKATSDAVTSGTTVTFSGVTAGTYYMSATEGSKAESSRVAVTVKAFGSVTNVDITTADSELEVGKTLALEYTTTPNGGAVAWSSDKEEIATVSNGTVTGVKVGVANITLAAADDGTIKDSVKVTVKGANQTASPYTFESKNMGVNAVPGSMAYDNFFTVLGSGNVSVSSTSEKEFSDGYKSTVRLQIGKAASTSENAVKFTTQKAADVDVYWVSGGTNRQVTILDSAGTAKATTSETVASNSVHKSSLTLTEGGTYYVGPNTGSTIYIFKIVVTEKGSTEQPGDDALTGITVSDTTVNLKVGQTKDVTVTVSPEGCTEELDVANTAPAIATATLMGNKLTIKANGTTAGTAKITLSGKTTTSVSKEITVKVSLKQMTCDLHKNGQFLASKVYDGQPYSVPAKVKDKDTGAEIKNATFEYKFTEDGTYSATPVPSRTDAGTTTFWFKATAEGYEEYTSTEGHRINIDKANPKLNIKADPLRVKKTEDADRFTTLTVTCDLPYADVDKVTVTGKIEGGDALVASSIVKQAAKGVWKVSFPDPIVDTVNYIFTASFPGNDNYAKAEDQTARVAVINSSLEDRTYTLTYDSSVIRVEYPDNQGSTDAAVLLGAAVEATATAPEGKEFDTWRSSDLNVTETQLKSNPIRFSMPGHNVTLEVVFKDKTTEPTEPVTKAALYDLLRNAEAYAESPVVATNADDVDKGEKWVTAADKKTFTDAIAAAQAVSSNPKATQAEVDKAVADLAKAWDAFTATFKDGAKSGGSSEPVKVTHTFESKTLPATAAADVANSDYAEDNYFKLVVKNGKTKYDKSNKEWTAEAFGDNAYNPGVDAIRFNSGDAAANAGIKFTTTSENAKVQIWWVQTGGDYWKDGAYDSTKYKDLRQVVVLKDGTQVHTSDDKHPDPNAAAGAATGRVKQNDPKYNEFTLADAATYTVGANTSGIYIFKIVVTETTTTGGGDTPVVPDTAARTALKKAIAAAKENMDSVKTSTDGSEYSKDEQWVTERAKTTYKRAIELAEFKANSARFNDEALTEAKAALDAVTADFNAAKRDGTKSSGSSSGGSSSSNVPSTGGGTTVKNEDGSKTTTKTDKTTGTVTETTTWPNGDKQVVVTEKDGTKTETVTKKDGTKTETVTKPDGSTTTAVTDAKGIKTETAVTASGEVSAKVSLPKNVDKTVVTIPVKDATEGTVAVIVDSKGNETVIKTAVATENGLELLVTGNVSVQIKDNAKKFVDIADDYWAKGAVDFVSSREIFKGVYETVFAPADLVNRGMMATVLYRLADAKAEGSNNFFDVPDGTWYTDAVTWANRSGVVTGYADGTFGPDDAVTREQMATMLFRYAKAMGMDISAKGDVSKFGDANDVSSWASEAMTWAVGVGLINGVADPATGTTLSPTKTATRAEVATIMQRMVKLMMQ